MLYCTGLSIVAVVWCVYAAQVCALVGFMQCGYVWNIRVGAGDATVS